MFYSIVCFCYSRVWKKIEKVTPIIVLIYEDGYVNRGENTPSDNIASFHYDKQKKRIDARLEYKGQIINAHIGVSCREDTDFLSDWPFKKGEYIVIFTFDGDDRYYPVNRTIKMIIE